MRLAFGPDDHDAFASARDRIVADFARADGERYRDVAEQVLELKWSYLDGDLGHWPERDVDAVLFEVYPAKVLLDDELIAKVVPGMAALLRFLARESPSSEASLEAAARRVERNASRFVAAMHDDDAWSFGKRMWSTAIAEGVDLSDPDAGDAWMRGFNARPLAERDQILGPLPSSRAHPGSIGPFEPVVLPTDEELGELARRTVLVARLCGLVEFVGAGRPLTDRGNLKLADGKELVALLGTDDQVDEKFGDRVYRTRSSEQLRGVDYTYRVALAMRLLAIDGRRVVPGPNAGWVPDEPLDIWYGAFLVMIHDVAPTGYHYRNERYGFGWYAEALDEALPGLLTELYRDRRRHAIDELVDGVWLDLLDAYDLGDLEPRRLEFEREAVDFSLRRAFDRLGELGIVAIADELVTPSQYVGVDRSGGTVALQPLGLCAMQRMLSRIADAPVAGGLRKRSAADLLRALADLPEPLARAEMSAWIVEHAADAATQLSEAMGGASEIGRVMAFRGLLEIGADAETAVLALADDPELAPFLTLWRVESGTAAPDEIDLSGDPEGWVRLLATVVELWGAQAAAVVWAVPAAGAGGIETMLDTVWRVRGDRTETALAAVGGHHPDKRIAKAARKAIFKHRSAR